MFTSQFEKLDDFSHLLLNLELYASELEYALQKNQSNQLVVMGKALVVFTYKLALIRNEF